jgi:hypothetical protein
MRCPYCGDRRTEVLKTVYRGHNSYRHRRCIYRGSRFSTQEWPVRWSRVDRKWPGPRPSRKGWRKRRTSALGGKCEVQSCGVDFNQAGISRHVDHIVPGVDPLGGVGRHISTPICPTYCCHCCQIDLPFSVCDGLGLTRRYSKASGEVVTNSGI